jgi:tuberculosinol/isotuberculosinol synthase
LEFETFLNLPTEEIARLVRQEPKVCVFPINGTRRWFMLEYPGQAKADLYDSYLRITWQRQIELYKLFFDHGIDTLLTPVFGPDLLQRDAAYLQLVEPGLMWLARDRELQDFYDAYDVRVRVYGDARRALDAFGELAQRTAHHARYRLFFGVCAHDPTETVTEIGVRFYQEHGRLPHKREIVAAYYGEPVEPVDLFIGFDRPTAFDMPLIATGNEDLYFTVSPSPYMDDRVLRAILYDHLYARRVAESYAELSAQDWKTLADFYVTNRRRVLGLGRKHKTGAFWYPLPQVELPARMSNDG